MTLSQRTERTNRVTTPTECLNPFPRGTPSVLPTSFFKGLCREGLRKGQRVVTEQPFLLLQDLIYLDFLLLKTVCFDYFPHSLQEQSIHSAQNCSSLSYSHFKNLSVEFNYMALSNFCLMAHHTAGFIFSIFFFLIPLHKDHEHIILGFFLLLNMTSKKKK